VTIWFCIARLHDEQVRTTLLGTTLELPLRAKSK